MPNVSVIIPIYNVEKYLKECLDSVINQTLKDIEIICINDGSTDNSLKILREYSQNDSRIQLIDKKNEGVGKARNIGIKSAAGEFVCFIDPDDIYPSRDILETLYNLATENNVVICGGEFSHFRDKNHKFEQVFGDTYLGYLFPKSGIIKYADYQFDYGFHRFIYNRNFLIENNIFYPEYKRFQDPPFFVKAMIKADKFYGLNKITYGYRHRYKKISWDTKKVNDLLLGLLDNFEFAQKNELQKLMYYTENRFLENYPYIVNYFDSYSLVLLDKIQKINPNLKKYCDIKIKNNIQKMFDCIYSVNKYNNHITVCILGIKIKIRRKDAEG